ncbi:hypothetical protein STEG23_028682, partial [Scotinomys teguina]
KSRIYLSELLRVANEIKRDVQLPRFPWLTGNSYIFSPWRAGVLSIYNNPVLKMK